MSSQHESRLQFIEERGKNKYGAKVALFRCACGTEKEFIVDNVRRGTAKSCGCLRKQLMTGDRRNLKHGLAKTPLYDVWHLMMRRCYEVGSKNYHQYGGRGISVCDAWHNVSVFNEWAISNGWMRGLQIDRIDTNGNYEPLNCRFVSSRINNNNRRDNRMLTCNGRAQTLQQWADELKKDPSTIRARIDKLKWSVERALTE